MVPVASAASGGSKRYDDPMMGYVSTLMRIQSAFENAAIRGGVRKTSPEKQRGA
jgi:hypothetical protein